MSDLSRSDMVTVVYPVAGTDRTEESAAVVTNVEDTDDLPDGVIGVADLFAFPRRENGARTFEDVPVYGSVDALESARDDDDDRRPADKVVPGIVAYVGAPKTDPKKKARRPVKKAAPAAGDTPPAE